jgi:hypothetical protein
MNDLINSQLVLKNKQLKLTMQVIQQSENEEMWPASCSKFSLAILQLVCFMYDAATYWIVNENRRSQTLKKNLQHAFLHQTLPYMYVHE